MIAFDYAALLLLLPLPWLVRRFVAEQQPATLLQLGRLPDELSNSVHSNKLPMVLLLLAWLCMVIALARPVWLGEPISVPMEHRDVMLVVDLSGSMDIEDMNSGNDEPISRMTAMKSVLVDFVRRREGDRLGLVLFADHGYLHTPLTLDIRNLEQQINQLVLGLVGYMTAIGEGVAIATKTFIDSEAPQRVMILLSDGSNTIGAVEPMAAAELAKESNVTIYSVGLGAESMLVENAFGELHETNPAWDLDEKLLTEIAELTGGQYFRARNREELAEVYSLIDGLEPISDAEQTWQPRYDLFHYPLLTVLVFIALLAVHRRQYG
ncbi:VWA domain-containing protein [Photobacterium lutimaris]|uniref:IMP dehydrogenase n=1 Tax=Photobacterium lutimaris TaxID=388278 RepID=A0A2T3IYT5_9GAMM|nr:VWA domain-containing protein [Photobacterium lutimaris]PSU33822.1 IMP dehydrogenase [Photobacterium lutimaris]TDR76147.1 Ca-activated chloride channel family protein [Photobacterium lutimaris]